LFDDICSKKGFPDKKYPLESGVISIKRGSYFMEMVNDLELFGIKPTITKWEKILMEDDEF